MCKRTHIGKAQTICTCTQPCSVSPLLPMLSPCGVRYLLHGNRFIIKHYIQTCSLGNIISCKLQLYKKLFDKLVLLKIPENTFKVQTLSQAVKTWMGPFQCAYNSFLPLEITFPVTKLSIPCNGSAVVKPDCPRCVPIPFKLEILVRFTALGWPQERCLLKVIFWEMNITKQE